MTSDFGGSWQVMACNASKVFVEGYVRNADPLLHLAGQYIIPPVLSAAKGGKKGGLEGHYQASF